MNTYRVPNSNFSEFKSPNGLQEVVQASATLARLSHLDRAFTLTYPLTDGYSDQSLANRANAIDWIREQWTALTSSDQITPAQVEDLAKKLGRRYSVHIRNFYIQQLGSSEQVNDYVTSAIKDLSSILTPPATKSQRGNKGPTLIVNYSTKVPFSSLSAKQAYVLKWTDWNEILMTSLYQLFCLDEKNNSPFFVPPFSAVDLEAQIHFSCKRQIEPIDAESTTQLRSHFSQIKTNYSPQSTPTQEILMISDKITGANILDFAKSRYPLLNPEQKEGFFISLGRVGMLDLIVANLDRFIQIYHKNNQYTLEVCEANLGNLMIDSFTHDPHLRCYAIDNGIQAELVSDLEHREQYLNFLKDLLSNKENLFDSLVTNIITSFDHALKTQIDDDQGNRELATKRLETFSQDVKEIGPGCIRQGLNQMYDRLQEVIIPKWNQTDFDGIKNQMKELLPNLLPSLNERFQLFQSMRAQ